MKKWILRLFVYLVLSTSSGALAGDYYVDPANGLATNDGTQAKPWKTIEEVVRAGHLNRATAGDTFHLLTGQHGNVDIQNFDRGHITIKAEPGHVAVLGAFWGHNVKNITLDGLYVTPMASSSGWYRQDVKGIITFDRTSGDARSQHIAIRNCKVFTVFDTSRWTANDWKTKASNGIRLYGTDSVIENNYVFNVREGIPTIASKTTIRNNWVHRFCGDAIKGAGDDMIIEHNIITDCFDAADGYHHDAVQFYRGGTNPRDLRNVLRGNVVIATLDKSRSLQAHLQGLTCFDEPWVDCTIENNIVISDTHHGITFQDKVNGGPINSVFRNNTVYGWKDGTIPTPIRIVGANGGNKVYNNLSTAFAISGGNQQGSNLQVTRQNEAAVFENVQALLFRLKSGSPAIDAGDAAQAPRTDFEGQERDSKPDIGADEVR